MSRGGRAKITDLVLTGSGVRTTVQVLGINPQTVMGEIKKVEAVNQHPLHHPTYAPRRGANLRLYADERWSFGQRKKYQHGLWWGEDAQTG